MEEESARKIKYVSDLRKGLIETKKFVLNYQFLKLIFSDSFFEAVDKQIGELEENPRALLHPIYNLMFKHDVQEGFSKLKLLEEYLALIFNQPIAEKQKRYIKSELCSCHRLNSLNVLFEISVLGPFLRNLSGEKLKLYPRTDGNKNVDIVIELVDRPVYIEITVLGISELDRIRRSAWTKTGVRLRPGWRNLGKDEARYIRKIEEKANQFIPDRPNVLIFSKFDFFPDIFSIKRALSTYTFSRIGLIVQFDRMDFDKMFEENLDEKCAISLKEKEKLNKIFKNYYRPLIYDK